MNHINNLYYDWSYFYIILIPICTIIIALITIIITTTTITIIITIAMTITITIIITITITHYNDRYISFAPMASAAYIAGRKTLATKLLDYEARASVTVPLLLSMKQDKLALDKALGSGDGDLIIIVVLHLRDHWSFVDFADFIATRPVAKNIYMKYCEAIDLPALKRLHYHLQKPVDAADIAVREAYRCEGWKERIQGLHIAAEFYKKDKKDAFAAQATEEQIRLLMHQRKCELESDDATFVDGSISDLITKYIKNGQVHRAMKVQQSFSVPEERLWHIEVRVLAECGAWQELAKLTANKRNPPIGFDPFIEACVEHKNYPEATKYIARLKDPYSQMEWLCNIGYWQKAVEVATVEKDPDALHTIRARCRDGQVVANIEKILREDNW
jgi:vacuolar protein sorting-associated protein 16